MCEIKNIEDQAFIKECHVEEKKAKASFIQALAKAQLEFKPVEKTNNNPFFKSSYAPYEEVWASVGKPLNENGFAVIHQTKIIGDKFYLITRLMHKDGHEESSFHEVLPEKSNNMQGKGSAETYAKRYNLVALTAVPVVDEDDDGNAAVGNKVNELNKSKETPISKDEVTAIKGFIEEAEMSDDEVDRFLKWVKADKIESIMKSKYMLCINTLKKKIEKNKVDQELGG